MSFFSFIYNNIDFFSFSFQSTYYTISFDKYLDFNNNFFNLLLLLFIEVIFFFIFFILKKNNSVSSFVFLNKKCIKSNSSIIKNIPIFNKIKYRYIFYNSKRFIYVRDEKRHELIITESNIYKYLHIIDDCRLFFPTTWHLNDFYKSNLSIFEEEILKKVCVQFYIEYTFNYTNYLYFDYPYSVSFEDFKTRFFRKDRVHEISLDIQQYLHYYNKFLLETKKFTYCSNYSNFLLCENKNSYFIYYTNHDFSKESCTLFFYSIISFYKLFKHDIIYNNKVYYYYVSVCFVGDLINKHLLGQLNGFPISAKVIGETDHMRTYECGLPYIVNIIIPPFFINKTDKDYNIVLSKIINAVNVSPVYNNFSDFLNSFNIHYQLHDNKVFIDSFRKKNIVTNKSDYEEMNMYLNRNSKNSIIREPIIFY